MTAEQRVRFALLPLDDRPVNVLLPLDVARIAGVEVHTPPVELLPNYRDPGDTAQLSAWLLDRAQDPHTSHLIVSLDMLCFGGLIASRISDDTSVEVLGRLEVLRHIRSMRPELKISAVSLVMRASDSYSAAEEPEYWAQYGRELHRLGGDIHRLASESTASLDSRGAEIPKWVVSDFARRRIRNHTLNLSALTLVEEGTIDFLALTSDDTSEFSAGSAEQEWLRHWIHFLPGSDRVLMYPGADEVGSVLVARAVSEHFGVSTSIRIVCPEPGGLDIVPPFENTPLATSIRRQIAAVGARETLSEADVLLVIHAPDPDRHDMFNGPPAIAHQAVAERTVAAVRDALETNSAVALADVRFSNGCDPALVHALRDAGQLEKLTSFGGWNTAGNTLGGVIATAVAATVGSTCGTLNTMALQQAILTRLLDDFGYQSVVRPSVDGQLFTDQFPVSDDAQLGCAESEIHRRLSHLMESELPFENWVLHHLSLPWRRSFEVTLGLERARPESVLPTG